MGEIYNLYLDYKQFSKKPLKIKEKLSVLRNEFEQRKDALTIIPQDFFFSDSEGYLIKKENENIKSIRDIITNDYNINIISTSNFNIYCDDKILENENQKEYDIFEYEEFTLEQFRDKKNIPKNFLFIDSNKNLIDFPEEKDLKLIDFIVKGKLTLKSFVNKNNDNHENNYNCYYVNKNNDNYDNKNNDNYDNNYNNNYDNKNNNNYDNNYNNNYDNKNKDNYNNKNNDNYNNKKNHNYNNKNNDNYNNKNNDNYNNKKNHNYNNKNNDNYNNKKNHNYNNKKNHNYNNNYNCNLVENINEFNTDDASIHNNNNSMNENAPRPILEPQQSKSQKSKKYIKEKISTSIYDVREEENIFSQVKDNKYYKILLLGEEGSGKTSFINSIINCIQNVKPDDNHRFIICPFGPTESIQVYKATNAEKKLFFKFIDTPGIKLEKGKSNIDDIKKGIYEIFFEEKFITAIFILIKNTDTRLNANIKSIHNNIFELFEKNLVKNIRFIISFYEDNKIQCEDLIKTLYGKFLDVNEEILFPINNNHIVNFQKSKITYDNFLNSMKNVKNFICKIIKMDSINLEISYLLIFYQNAIENFIKQIKDNFFQIFKSFNIPKKNENDSLFQLFFKQIINNIIFFVKQILTFEKLLKAHSLKTIDLKEKILKELNLTNQNQSIFEKTQEIFLYLFNFIDDNKSEIDYTKIKDLLYNIYLNHSKNNMKVSTLNKEKEYDNLYYKNNTKNYPNLPANNSEKSNYGKNYFNN